MDDRAAFVGGRATATPLPESGGASPGIVDWEWYPVPSQRKGWGPPPGFWRGGTPMLREIEGPKISK